MKTMPSAHRPHLLRAEAAGGRCVTLFSVCLFIVILSVVAWAMHRRLAQYDTILPTMHQSTATKVCLTERIQIPVPSVHAIDRFTMLFEIFLLTTIWFVLRNSEASLHLRVLDQKRYGLCPSRSRPGLIHFFYLPPPPLSSPL